MLDRHEQQEQPRISLPTLIYCNSAPVDDSKQLAEELATKFNTARVVRRGLDAWLTIQKSGSFESWKAIGAALRIGRDHALKTSGASAPIGRTYSAAFSKWIEQHGFATMDKSSRSCALDLDANIAAVEAWRNTLDERKRRRLRDAQSIMHRWRADTGPAEASGYDVARAAAAAWWKFVACVRTMPADQAAPFWRDVQAQADAFLDAQVTADRSPN